LEDVVIAENGEDNVVERQRGEVSRGLCVEVKGVFSWNCSVMDSRHEVFGGGVGLCSSEFSGST